MKKLVGEGKPFHSAVDKTAALLKRKSGTGAEFMKELMGLPGIKQTELQERGLTDIMGMPKMTHEQFMAELGKKPATNIREKVLGSIDAEEIEKATNEKILADARFRADADISKYGSNKADAEYIYQSYLKNLTANKENIRKKVEQEHANRTHHGEYTLPGGENYREMLIKAPKGVDNQEKIMELEAKLRHIPMFNSTPEQQADIAKYYNQIRELKEQEAASPKPFQGVPQHFGGEPGILASMRLKDRFVPDPEGPHNVKIVGGGGTSNKKFDTREEAEAFANVKHQGGYKTEITPLNNKKYLHLEELQSDWHQQGREAGYKRPNKGGLPELKEGWKYEDYNGKIGIRDPRGILAVAVEKPEDAIRYIRENGWAKPNSGVPDAPFKKNWEEMALKRLIHHAAEKGYHGIVVTPGKEQINRYEDALRKNLDHLDYEPYKDEKTGKTLYELSGHKGDKQVFTKEDVTPEELKELIGKDMLAKIEAGEGRSLAEESPLRPNWMRLEGDNISIGGEGMKGFYDKKVPNILNSIGKKYGVKTQLHGHAEKINSGGLQRNPEGGYTEFPPEFHHLHHFPITEEMRKDVLTNGLPLYNKGGTVHMADGGDMDQMQLEMMDKKMKQDSVGHYSSKGSVKKKDQTVKNAQRMAYPGIYGNPKDIAALAASRVATEDPALKLLFGVTRADMYQQAQGRKGMPHLGMLPGMAANPKGAMSAEGVMSKRNEQRLIDVMGEAQKHQGLVHGMEPWYYMNPLFDHMVKLLGLQKATEEYKKMNALMGMASSSSEVNTEIPRGSLAYWLQNQGRFNEFVKHGGKRSEDRPADFGETPGHLAHKTAHAIPMQRFLERGEVSMKSPKVPMYIEASGVPATGFQTRTPVGDAHWSRAVGLADTRNPKFVKGEEVVPGASVTTPEMSSLGPWWQQNIASKVGLESVPAQALTWGAFSPQTGVTTPIGAPKLELIAKQIMQTASRLGVSPQTARDMVLTGKERMGKAHGGAIHMADGGQVDVQSIGVEEAPNMDVKMYFPPRPAQGSMLPVGGIQQAQQAPMQPPPPMPNQPQPQQQPSPAPIQTGQPPSNILQMTPQGQAMNAIKPPQMARGGKVDRDTMMFALMNRNKKVKYG